MDLLEKLMPKRLEWWEHMTEKDIAVLEQQGYNVTKLKAHIAQKEAEEQATARKLAEAIHLEKLEPYEATPRNTDTAFFTAVAGSAPMQGQDQWRIKHQNAQLIYAAVVQADRDLWYPGTGKDLSAVVVYTNDPVRRFDTEWLLVIAEQLTDMEQGAKVPKDCQALILDLQDEPSLFLHAVGQSVSGGLPVWCQAYRFPKQSNLPNGCLPPSGILPFLLFCDGDKGIELIEIPGQYYM